VFEDLSYNVIIGRDFFFCQSLSIFVAKGQKDWDEFLRLILFAHRTYNLEAIGDIPFFVLYGRKVRLLIDVKLLPAMEDDVTTSVFEHR